MFPASEPTDGAILKTSGMLFNATNTNPASHRLCQDTAKMKGYGGYHVPFIHERKSSGYALWDKDIPVVSSKVCS